MSPHVRAWEFTRSAIPEPPAFEPLERRELLSASPALQRFELLDSDGDRVVISLTGPGSLVAQVGQRDAGAEAPSIVAEGTNGRSRLTISVKKAKGGDGEAVIGGIEADALGALSLKGVRLAERAGIHVRGTLGAFAVSGDAREVRLAAGAIDSVKISGAMAHSLIASAGSIRSIVVGGEVSQSQLLAGVALREAGTLEGATYDLGRMERVRIGGAVTDSIIGAGADPGTDGVFRHGDVLAGGVIGELRIRGALRGTGAVEGQPGVYAATIETVSIAGHALSGKSGGAGELPGIEGSAVLDPLPSPGIALGEAEIRRVFEQAIARATQLGVNATISLVDREGNILGVVRMTDPSLAADPGVSTIDAGGVGGLEGVTVASSITATSKAGTAAFLSTSGNAFSTRTAGFIIQSHFPSRVRFRPSGPLFGVQFSNLPTSDINRLPLGLAADPGGVPLYRDGQVLAGIGVELDGRYTAPGSDLEQDRRATLEEQIALAGQAGLEPPKKIRATRIFVDGLRLALKEAAAPKLAALGALLDFETLAIEGKLDVLIAPRESPATMFTSATVAGVTGETVLRMGGTLTTDGVMVGGQQLTAADVQTVLEQAHALNARLRAQIRKDRPQTSQVTVSVVDTEGKLLGVFRTGDAPMFGFDVSVQKARTAAFFSSPEAGDLLRAAEGGSLAGYADRAAAFGVMLDGSVAMADRTGGFLSRPFFPDGIPGNGPGPFAPATPERFSPFNTGLQTALLTTNLVAFLTDFAAVGDEGLALERFGAGLLGGGGVTAATLPTRNGIQIFPGSVPLYKNGVLVGAVGVSGDGIEQDDYVAFSGAIGFQQFGAGVQRADEVTLMGIRLPYVKLPRSPFGGR